MYEIAGIIVLTVLLLASTCIDGLSPSGNLLGKAIKVSRAVPSSLYHLPLARRKDQYLSAHLWGKFSGSASKLALWSDASSVSGTDLSEITPGLQPAVSEDENISLLKEGISFPSNLNGSDVRVGIIMARWNGDVVKELYKGVNESLTACGVQPSNVFTTYVPGAYELPVTARLLAASKRVDVVVCLGCLIKGETMHFEYISQAVSMGLMQVSVDSFVPCIFGVLTVLNKEQAVKRCTGKSNEGLGWGSAAVEMGLARMSALGMDKKGQGQQQGGATPFVTFNSSSLPQVRDGKNSSQPLRKIGF